VRSLAILALLVVATVVAVPILVRKAVIDALADISGPPVRGVLPKLAAASAVRRYALPPDRSISPEAAGKAYHALVVWSDSGRPAALRPAPDSAANEWHRAEGTDSLGALPPKEWCGGLMARAAGGLSADQAATLREVTARPRNTTFRTFARAPQADILGTRWTFQGETDRSLFYMLLPIPRVSSFQSAVRVWCGRAALELHDGTPARADTTLREALSASLLLMDEGPTVVELLVGAAMAKSVALDLATLYELTGRANEGARIREAIARARPIQLPGRLGEKKLDGWDVIEALPAAAARRDIPPALKWEWIHYAQAVKLQQYCLYDDELGADYAVWRDGLRAGLTRRPSDAMYFDWITRKPARRGSECYEPAEVHEADGGSH
jgi:hypothetical protein